ncbi:DUF4326 domain-containing protein [Pseudonocardia humida]
MPPGAVYVGRPSRRGNPWSVAEHGAAEAVARYRAWLLADSARLAVVRAELAGRDLACWCRLDASCHADVLLELANTTSPAAGHVMPRSGNRAVQP